VPSIRVALHECLLLVVLWLTGAAFIHWRKPAKTNFLTF
jgi:hypothetical protein